MPLQMTRREAMGCVAASLAGATLQASHAEPIDAALLQRHTDLVSQAVSQQNTDTASRWFGGFPSDTGLYYCTTTGAFLANAAAAFFHPQSRYYQDKQLLERMQWAAAFLERSQSADGNIDLPSTNFNSPPDTGFVVHTAATAARLAQLNNHASLIATLEPFLRNAGRGMAKGGIHTPNHRWVVCAALAQIQEVYPDPRHLKRIDEWLAEGIDIDEEGQYTERSTATYNAVTNKALVKIAHKLNRPELLEPVRKNLDAMAYLLHSNHEVVTEISHRQDLNTKRTMDSYWFALRYMAIHDQNGLYASMLAPHEPDRMELPALMEYPELQQPLPARSAIPDQYEIEYPRSRITRIRRGKRSTTLMHTHNSRWITMRNGEAVVNGVRFAGSFFGKGQFKPTTYEKRADGYYFEQRMTAPYYQPITDPDYLPISQENVGRTKGLREKTEICSLVYNGRIRETEEGFELAIDARGTDNVPMAVEISFRPGGTLTGVVPAPGRTDAFLLKDGFAEYRMGEDVIRFGPGRIEHTYIQLRGAEGKLPGLSVYLTGLTPFELTLQFQLP